MSQKGYHKYGGVGESREGKREEGRKEEEMKENRGVLHIKLYLVKKGVRGDWLFMVARVGRAFRL